MIIVSQDKTEMFNLDNIFRLYVDTWSSEEFATEPDCWCVKAEKSQDNLICAFLGTYKTKERAKEVLQGIIRAYEKAGNIMFETDEDERLLKLTHNSNVFEMPED